MWRPAGSGAVELRGRWLSRQGDPLADASRCLAPVPQAVRPGAETALRLAVPGPDALGDFRLELTLGREDRVIAAATVGVHLTGPAAEDVA